MKVPEAVRKGFHAALPSISVSAETAWAIDAALEAALEQLREELEGDEALEAVIRASGRHELGSAKELIRRDIRTAWDSVLGDKEEGR